jgi:hypothetical protein
LVCLVLLFLVIGSNEVTNKAWTNTKVTGSLGSNEGLQGKLNKEDWNKIHLVVKGNRLQHYVNGILRSDVTDNDKANHHMTGIMGVQVHAGPPLKV